MRGNWILVALGCLVGWGWASSCGAEGLPPAVERAQAAVVQIDHRGSGGGSGTYLGRGLVVTCDHLFRRERGEAALGRIVVSFPGGQASTARLVGQDRVWDLALLALDRPPEQIAGVEWATSAPALGEGVVSLGYGRSGDLQANLGRVTGYGRDKEQATQLADTLLITGKARHGDSGGPILNHQGQLVGVLWGSDGQIVVGTQVGMCRQIVHRWTAEPASSFSAQPAQWVSAACPPPSQSMRPSPAKPSGSQTVAKPVAEEARLRQLEEELSAIRAQLEQIASRPGPMGPAGPPGPMGPPGPPGDAANLDTAKLADEVRRQVAGSIRVRVDPVR